MDEVYYACEVEIRASRWNGNTSH